MAITELVSIIQMKVDENYTEEARFTVGILKDQIDIEISHGNSYLSTNIDEILKFLRAATNRQIKLTHAPFTEPRAPQMRSVHILDDVKRYRRQEERLAALIDALISDVAAAWIVFQSYTDSAAFASRAIQHLRSVLRADMDGRTIELCVSVQLPAIISAAYPFQKGRVLLAFAHILGKYRLIGNVIREKTLKSNSNSVSTVRDLILKELNDK